MAIEISFVSKVTNLSEFEELLLEYYSDVLQVAEAAGVPKLAPEDLVQSSVDHLDEMLPPNGRLALARGTDGRLLGCGFVAQSRSFARLAGPEPK